MVGRTLKPECPNPFQPFDTGWEFIFCFLWIYLCPFYHLGLSCCGAVMEVMTVLSFLPFVLRRLYVRCIWGILLHAGCCAVVTADLVVAFEDWFSSSVDIFGRVFWAVDSFFSLFPCFHCRCVLPRRWDHVVSWGRLGLGQLHPRRVFPPSCTSGRHSRFRSDKRYVNAGMGAWCRYRKFQCYQDSRQHHSFTGDEDSQPPPWFGLPLFLSSLWSRIRASFHITVHIQWWFCLRHPLDHFHFRLLRGLGFATRSRGGAFGTASDPSYNSPLWHHAPVFGTDFRFDSSLPDSNLVFAASNTSLSRGTVPSPSPHQPISLLSSSFSMPCTQQLWPILRRTRPFLQCRSGGNDGGKSGSGDDGSGGSNSSGGSSGGSNSSGGANDEDVQRAQQRGRRTLARLSMILDSGANMNIFRDIELLKQIPSIPAQ